MNWLHLSSGLINLPSLFLGEDSFLVNLAYYKEGMALLKGIIILICFAEISVLNNVYDSLKIEFLKHLFVKIARRWNSSSGNETPHSDFDHFRLRQKSSIIGNDIFLAFILVIFDQVRRSIF
jgi:hypothetical protein